MKTPAKFLSLLAATCLALAPRSQAQTETFTTQTLSSWAGNTVNFQPTASEGTLGETFTGLTQINSLTYAFVSSSPTPTSGTLNYEFGQWNGSSFSTDLVSGSLTVNGSNFTTPLASSYVNVTDGVFGSGGVTDLSGFSLDPTKTYALLFTSATNQNFGLGWIGGNPYSYGKAYDSAGNLGSNVDYAFAYISVEVPAAIPESGTIASLLGALLVAGLVIFRLRQRRQQLAPVPAIAA